MDWDPEFKPRLRRLEGFPLPGQDGQKFGLRDPSGLSKAVMTLSPGALQVMAMMDGANTCVAIQEICEARFQAQISTDVLLSMLNHLDEAHFLDGTGFDSYYKELLAQYRARPFRELQYASGLRIVDKNGKLFDDVLADAGDAQLPRPVVGLVAPHLDYPRGRPCYAAAYATLRGRPAPKRVVILGTNHFGQSASVVATASGFETPLGTTRTDVSFLEGLEERCGSLRKYELDHANEHSVELQVAWLQHLFGPGSFEIVAFLCPDPCGPTGTAPQDGCGVDLSDFARALEDLIAEDALDTLIVAGADLSHVGKAFGDERMLDAAYLDEVRARDRRALSQLEANAPERWVSCIAEDNNRSNICSAGCIYVLATAVRSVSGKVLRYHQAVDQASQTCVTCAAVAFA